VCYLIVYHYELNAILALPISGLNDKTIFDAYKIASDELADKGFKPKLNIMDNQATKYIKKFSHQSASSSLWSPTTTG
jgi:hypothetical protein